MDNLTEFPLVFRLTPSCFLSPTHPLQATPPPSQLPATQVKRNRHLLKTPQAERFPMDEDFTHSLPREISASSLGIWNPSSKHSVYQSLLSNIIYFSVVTWNFLNFPLVGWLVTGGRFLISINDWLPQISSPPWMTLAPRSRHSVIEVWLDPVCFDQQPYFGGMLDHLIIWWSVNQFSSGHWVKSSLDMVILWSMLW